LNAEAVGLAASLALDIPAEQVAAGVRDLLMTGVVEVVRGPAGSSCIQLTQGGGR
jgi:hypothetical protein